MSKHISTINTFKGYKIASIFFVIFYLVGLLGMLLPFSSSLFIQLIPFALILSFFALAYFHDSKVDLKTVLTFTFIYFISFAVEAIGVNTGLIFGQYEYGAGLGVKVFQTPLIIGINWLFLVYTTSAIVRRFTHSGFVTVILASIGMLIYDLVLEQVAPKLDMWYWKADNIPLQNYFAWFILAVIFNSLFQIFKIKTDNKIAFLIFGCQFIFFLFLFIFLS